MVDASDKTPVDPGLVPGPCKTCRFYKCIGPWMIEGACVRRSPVASPDKLPVWPVVCEDYCCGEWAKKLEDAEVIGISIDTLSRWKKAQLAEVEARKAWTQARKDLEVADEEHRKANPLSPALKEILVEAFSQGQALCCTKGRQFLDTILDACWAEHLNEWATEELGCTEFSRPGGYAHERHLEKLKAKMERS